MGGLFREHSVSRCNDESSDIEFSELLEHPEISQDGNLLYAELHEMFSLFDTPSPIILQYYKAGFEFEDDGFDRAGTFRMKWLRFKDNDSNPNIKDVEICVDEGVHKMEIWSIPAHRSMMV